MTHLLKQKNSFVFFLILISLLMGSIWVSQAWSQPLRGDEVGYYKIGQNLCREHKFAYEHQGQLIPTLSRPPFYPFLISIFYCLFGDQINFIRIFQIFLLVGIVILIYLMAKLIFNEKNARFSSLLTSLFPAIGILTGYLFTEITFIFLLLLGTLFLVYFFKNEKKYQAFLSGIFFGLATLTRAIPLLFPIFLIIFLFFYNKFKFNSLLKKSFILLFSFLLITSPWLIRNYLIFKEVNISDVGSLMIYNRAYRINYYSSQENKHFILLSLFGSYLTKKIDKNYDYSFSKFEPHAYRRSSDFPVQPGQKWDFEMEPDEGKKILFQEAKTIIFQQPIKYLAYSFLEFFRIHTPLITDVGMTDLFVETYPEISDYWKTAIIILIKFAYLIFFILVFYGIIASFNKFKLTLPLLIILLYIILLLCSMETIPRYSIPLYPLYFMFFSFGLLKLMRHGTK